LRARRQRFRRGRVQGPSHRNRLDLVIDPHPANGRARRPFMNAGFRGEAVVATADGPAVPMVFEGTPADRAGDVAGSPTPARR
jgi:hypothetical protein